MTRCRAVPPLLIVTATLLMATPLFGGSLVEGHDAREHAMRSAEFGRALAGGTWWPQWSQNLGRGYGEPIFLFNPPLFYFLAGLSVLAGIPVVWAVNLATACLLILAGLGMYAWIGPLFGRPAAVVGATAYVWAPYVLLDLYVRQALTELAAICVLPWALWALTRTCLESGRRRLAVAGGCVGALLLASTPAAVVTAPALVGQVIVLAGAGPRIGIARGVTALGLGALLAAAFWVPAAAERQYLRFDRLLIGQPAFSNHFLDPWQLFSSQWGFGTSQSGTNDRLGFGLGEVHLALAAVAIGLLAATRARGLLRRQVVLALAIGALGLFMTLEAAEPIWTSLTALQYLQFPWRFLLLAATASAVLAAVPAAVLSRRAPVAGALAAAACAAGLIAGSWDRARPNGLEVLPSSAFEPDALTTRDRGLGTAHEYETIWTEGRPDEPAVERLVVRSGAATVTELAQAGTAERFEVAARSRSRMRLNSFYFPGWAIYVDNRRQSIDWSNPSGLIEFWLDRGEHVAEARFEPTPARWAGRALSAIGLALTLWLGFWSTPPTPEYSPDHPGVGERARL